MITNQRTANNPTEPPAPCSCGCPTFWRSAYGGPLRCAVCEPWPSIAMVGERWTLWTRPDGGVAWTRANRVGERATAPCGSEPGPIAAEDDGGLRWANVTDEDGEWLVIWRDRAASNTHTAAAAAGGGDE